VFRRAIADVPPSCKTPQPSEAVAAPRPSATVEDADGLCAALERAATMDEQEEEEAAGREGPGAMAQLLRLCEQPVRRLTRLRTAWGVGGRLCTKCCLPRASERC
jgi:hypothetical protein